MANLHPAPQLTTAKLVLQEMRNADIDPTPAPDITDVDPMERKADVTPYDKVPKLVRCDKCGRWCQSLEKHLPLCDGDELPAALPTTATTRRPKPKPQEENFDERPATAPSQTSL